MYNDSKHDDILVAKWLKDNRVNVLEWPSQRPDFNPLGHLWAEQKKWAEQYSLQT